MVSRVLMMDATTKMIAKGTSAETVSVLITRSPLASTWMTTTVSARAGMRRRLRMGTESVGTFQTVLRVLANQVTVRIW
jgi:hypothetical protein